MIYSYYLALLHFILLDDDYYPSERRGAELDTLSGSESTNIVASETKWPYGDPLYTTIKTKPEGSGGE